MQKCKSWGLIAVGLLLVGLLYWIGNHEPKSQESQKQASHTEQTDRTTSPVSNQAGSDKDGKPYKPNCSQQDDADLCIQTRMAEAAENQSFYTLLSIIILVFATIAAGLAAVYARAAVKEGKRAADEAEKGAEAAFAAVAVSKKASERQLRAYVVIKNGFISFESNNQGTQFSCVRIVLQNAGQTPAYNFSTSIKCEANSLFNQPPMDNFVADEDRVMSIVGPGMDVALESQCRITAEQFGRIHDNKSFVFVWGRCDYTDINNQSKYFIFRCTQGNLVEREDGKWMHSIKPHGRGYEAN